MAFIGVCVVFIAIVLLILSIPEEKKKKEPGIWQSISIEYGWTVELIFFLALNLVCFIVPFLIECHTVQLNSQMKIWVTIIPKH